PSTTSGGNLRLLYGGTLHLSNMIDQPGTQLQSQRPKRADARRNYDVLVGAARGRCRAGRARDWDALPALPDAAGAPRGGLRRRGRGDGTRGERALGPT